MPVAGMSAVPGAGLDKRFGGQRWDPAHPEAPLLFSLVLLELRASSRPSQLSLSHWMPLGHRPLVLSCH